MVLADHRFQELVGGRRKSVLIVGEEFRDGIRIGVELVGEAVDGEDAIKKAESTYPDLIILDIIMPKKSGIEALSTIKDKFPDVTVVMISINEGQSYRKLAEVYRVDKYIGKNSDDINKELLEIIQQTQRKLSARNN